MRKAVSITLGADNLLWLRAQAAATPSGSLSGVLDRLVTEARQAGRAAPEAIRSVVGTISAQALSREGAAAGTKNSTTLAWLIRRQP
jgi:hypothetical protein